MANLKCPKCGCTNQETWEGRKKVQCRGCLREWIPEEDPLVRFGLSNHVWAWPGKYGSTTASIGVPTLGSTPIGKLSGIPGDDIVRDHRGSSVGRVKDVGSYKVLEWGWWLP